MERNNRNSSYSTRQIIGSLTSIGGYMIGSVLIGMYIDSKFFNNGISVIIAVIIGIIAVVINVIKLVIISRDN